MWASCYCQCKHVLANVTCEHPVIANVSILFLTGIYWQKMWEPGIVLRLWMPYLNPAWCQHAVEVLQPGNKNALVTGKDYSILGLDTHIIQHGPENREQQINCCGKEPERSSSLFLFLFACKMHSWPLGLLSITQVSHVVIYSNNKAAGWSSVLCTKCKAQDSHSQFGPVQFQPGWCQWPVRHSKHCAICPLDRLQPVGITIEEKCQNNLMIHMGVNIRQQTWPFLEAMVNIRHHWPFLEHEAVLNIRHQTWPFLEAMLNITHQALPFLEIMLEAATLLQMADVLLFLDWAELSHHPPLCQTFDPIFLSQILQCFHWVPITGLWCILFSCFLCITYSASSSSSFLSFPLLPTTGIRLVGRNPLPWNCHLIWYILKIKSDASFLWCIPSKCTTRLQQVACITV